MPKSIMTLVNSSPKQIIPAISLRVHHIWYWTMPKDFFTLLIQYKNNKSFKSKMRKKYFKVKSIEWFRIREHEQRVGSAMFRNNFGLNENINAVLLIEPIVLNSYIIQLKG